MLHKINVNQFKNHLNNKNKSIVIFEHESITSIDEKTVQEIKKDYKYARIIFVSFEDFNFYYQGIYNF